MTPSRPAADSRSELPLPPLAMRKLVGPTNVAAFDNPSGELVYGYLDERLYEAVLDFGCGCGRVARQLIQQRPRPRRYLGIDLHLGMVEWCRRNLQPHAPGFEFHHHDVWSYHFNSGADKAATAPFPAATGSFTLVDAHSVFTHLTEEQTVHYLRESARVLRTDGVFRSTWFLIDKADFPMMQSGHNALYVSYVDPAAAVVYDGSWVRDRARDAGLTVVRVIPPSIRGYQWILLMKPSRPGIVQAEFPRDEAPLGRVDLPELPPDPERIGIEPSGPLGGRGAHP